MPLNDSKVRAASLPEGKKQLKITDGNGLYLLVTKSGKYWRMDYRFAGKRKTLSIGVYPETSLREARSQCVKAKDKIGEGTDPSQAKQIDKIGAKLNLKPTFGEILGEWLKLNEGILSEGTLADKKARMEKHALPWLGNLELEQIGATEILTVLKRVEGLGLIETTHRVKMIISQVFRYAIATGRALHDPARDLSPALKPVKAHHRSTIKDPKKAGQLMRDIDALNASLVVKCAVKLSAYVFLRPVELRTGEWSEIDFENAEWRIPAEKMKMREMHIVPLSTQAVSILKEVYPLTGHGRYIFPSVRTDARPMSENTVTVALRRIGYDKGDMCAHGFRGMASTLLHEQGWNSDVIERQLAHKEGNAIKSAYNHARHLPERKRMMQQWADYLDALRDGADVISIGRLKA
jgi:integrase